MVGVVGVVSEPVDPAVCGGHRVDGASQVGVDQGTEQIEVVEAGRSGGQRDGQRRKHRPDCVGDGVRSRAGEMLVEDVGDAEGGGGVGNQERACIGADRPVLVTSMIVLVVLTVREILFLRGFWLEYHEY